MQAEGPMQLPASCIGPSAGKVRPPQDDRAEEGEGIYLNAGVFRYQATIVSSPPSCMGPSAGKVRPPQDDRAREFGTIIQRRPSKASSERQPLIRSGIQVNGRTAAPSPPASLSGEGLEGGDAAVSFGRGVACHVSSLLAASVPRPRTRQKTLPATPLRSLPRNPIN